MVFLAPPVGILERHRLSLQILKRTVDPTVSLYESWWDDISNMKRNAVTAGKKAARKGKTKGKAAAPKEETEQEEPDRRMLMTEEETGTDSAAAPPIQNQTKAEVISTDTIKAYIETNSTLTAEISHVLRLEYKIYDMALIIHNQQCARLASQYPEIKCIE